MPAARTAPKLERQPAPITEKIPPFRAMIYGDGGVGKTTLALTFPKPIVIDTDGGLEGDAVVGVSGDQWAPEKWQDLNAIYFWLKGKVQKDGYETVVVDAADTLASFLRFEAMDQPTKTRPENARLTELVQPEQPDYGKVAAAFEQFLINLRKLNVHVVLTAGARDPNPEKGILKRRMNLQPAVEDVIEHWANVIGELTVVEIERNGKKEEHRVLHTRASDPVRKNKTRFGALRPHVSDPTYTKMRRLVIAKQKEQAQNGNA